MSSRRHSCREWLHSNIAESKRAIFVSRPTQTMPTGCEERLREAGATAQDHDVEGHGKLRQCMAGRACGQDKQRI